MKDERAIIYIEADEEIPGVIDRVKEEKNDQITLVVPKASILLQSVINLKLLLRVSKEEKKHLAIVSHDPIGRNLASQVGIPAYDSVNAKIPVLQPKKEEPDEVIEIDNSTKQSPDKSTVTIHHFQDETISEPAAQVASPQLPVEESGVTPLEPPEEIMEMSEEISLAKMTTAPVKDIPVPTVTKTTNRQRRLVIFGGIIAVLIILIIMVITIPKATLTLSVPSEDFEGSVDIQASNSQKEINFESATIPAERVETVEESSQKVDATGKKNIGEKAKGDISFNNAWSTESQQLPAGTKLTKDGKTFLTVNDVSIPGATLSLKEGQVVTNPGKANGPIIASDSGEEYNVGSGRYTIVGLPSDRQGKIYAESSTSLSGGSSKEITVVSRQDIESGKEKVKAEIAKVAKDDLVSQAKGLVLLDKAIAVETISSTSSANEGDQVDNTTITVKAKAIGLAYKDSSLKDTFLNRIATKIPDQKELFMSEGDSIKSEVKSIDTAKDQMSLAVSVKTKLTPKLDKDSLRAKITGKTADQAKQTAETIEGVESAEVSINPNLLFGHLPFWAKRIVIAIAHK